MSTPHAIAIEGLPPCEPNTSQARVFAAYSAAAVVYECKSDEWPDSDPLAVALFSHCRFFEGGGPNDEAFHRHRFASYLRMYSLQELVDSPWMEERARIADRSGSVGRPFAGMRHFCLALKEEMFECIARSCALVGVYPTEESAVQAAVHAVWPGRPRG